MLSSALLMLIATAEERKGEERKGDRRHVSALNSGAFCTGQYRVPKCEDHDISPCDCVPSADRALRGIVHDSP